MWLGSIKLKGNYDRVKKGMMLQWELKAGKTFKKGYSCLFNRKSNF